MNSYEHRREYLSLAWTKTNYGGTERVWFYNMKADGRSFDSKRNPVSENNIPDVVKQFHNKDKEAD